VPVVTRFTLFTLAWNFQCNSVELLFFWVLFLTQHLEDVWKVFFGPCQAPIVVEGA
jgi:hypothetical protein